MLTPTARCARELGRSYDDAQRNMGLAAWQPARVLSWKAWAGEVWADAVVAGTIPALLLNDLQEKALWRSVLEGTDELGLQPSAAIASLCSSAIRLLGACDLHDSFSSVVRDPATNTGAFSRWYCDFTSACQQDGLLPAAYVDAELAAKLRMGSIKTGHAYVLYGFGELSPAQQAVVSALQQAGAAVTILEPASVNLQPPVLVRCDDHEAELNACCEWVKSRLADDSTARLAVVVPDLDDCRSTLESDFREQVAPWMQDVTGSYGPAPYEISTGRPLSRLPMIADAFRLLQWCAGPVSFQDAGAVLRSSSLGIAASPEEGAELEAWVLQDTRAVRTAATLRGDVSLQECERMLGQNHRAVSERLRTLRYAAGRSLEGRHTFAGFGDRVRQLLSSAGWPGQAPDNLALQAMQRWDAVLDRVASLDIFGNRVSFIDWLEAVRAAADETRFAPESTGAPVQVLTMAEAAGITFDHLWFLHADEGTWPPRLDPHPLLPRHFQRQLAMPGSSASVDEAAWKQALKRLVAAAGTSRFSYAARGSEGELRPSPLLQTIKGLQYGSCQRLQHPAPVFSLEEAADPLPLPALPDSTAGGVGILTSQAQCGFRAFAERRLLIREMEGIDTGFSPAERGEQVHAVLQRFWSIVKNHKELAARSRSLVDVGRASRDDVLSQCIEEVLPAGTRHAWDASYLQVQRKRLHRLVSDWLDVELKRTPFEVAELEYEVRSAEVGPLRMNIRVDRIDRVDTPAGPASILIDYKTGNAERKDWFGDRPDAPQLPAYAIAAGIPNVQGIAFARVRVGQKGMNFEQILADRSLLGDVKNRRAKEPNFDERMEEWRRDLTALAEAFARGEATVEPKDYLTTCKGCASRLLCRVDVARLEPDDDLLEEAEEEAAV